MCRLTRAVRIDKKKISDVSANRIESEQRTNIREVDQITM